MSDWRQTELEALWFDRVERGMELLAQAPHLNWDDVADRYRCGPSTLRTWRRRYWQARADRRSQAQMSGNERAAVR